MLRHTLLALALLAPVVVATAASAQSTTTRIEPRPYYGAVVTVEQGVRVWRPLPPIGHMIINPTNAPVHLSFADVRETHTSHNYHHGATDVPVATQGGHFYGGSHFIGRHRGRVLGRHFHRGRIGHGFRR